MTRYMLDTNIVSDMLRNPRGRVVNRITEVGEGSLCVSVVVAAELRFGAVKSGSASMRARVDAVLARIPVLPLDKPADAAYSDIRAELEGAGRSIGPTDLLIAAHARALSATVVTANVGEFSRVSGLTVENWISQRVGAPACR